MTDISDLLKQIKTAVKGEDVRGSIHDAIEKCYTDGNWNATTGMVDKLARDRIDKYLQKGTGQLNEVQLYPKSTDSQDLTIYCEMPFSIEHDPREYDIIRVYYKVVKTGTPQIFEFTGQEFYNDRSVIAGSYFQKNDSATEPCPLSIRRINIKHVDGSTDPTAYIAYDVARWNWNGATNGIGWSGAVDGASVDDGDFPAGQIVKITGIKYADIGDTVNTAIEEYMEEHGGGSSGGGSDTPITGLVNTENIADRAVTMAKTDFYYTVDTSERPTWIRFTTATSSGVPRAYVDPENYDAMFSAVTNKLSLVVDLTQTADTTYWGNTRIVRFSCRTASYSTQVRGITTTVKTVRANDKYYGVIEITRENLMTAYNKHLADLTDYPIDTGMEVQFGNVVGAFTEGSTPFAFLGDVTSETINGSGTQTVISQDFVNAVKAAIGEMNPDDDTTTTGKVKNKLNGKVMINLGDSYTKGMESQFATLASKYGMVADNRGVVSSSICGDINGNKGFSPMWNRANTIVSDYTSGKAINGATYHTSDVAIITFMGGANDGYGIETWIGTGIHETNKETIYGACNHIFNVLAKNFPNAKLICVTQPSHYNLTVSSITSDSVAQTLGFENLAELQQFDDIQLSAYSMDLKETAVRNTAEMYGWSIVDMFKNMPTVFNPTNRSAYWNSDKLHLSAGGYALVLNAIDAKIVELVLA